MTPEDQDRIAAEQDQYSEREKILALAGKPRSYLYKVNDPAGGEPVWVTDIYGKPVIDVEPLYTANQVLAARKPLEEEIERLKEGGPFGLWKQRCKDREETIVMQRVCLFELRQQLAAAQAQIVGYREALYRIATDDYAATVTQAAKAEAALVAACHADASALESLVAKAGEAMKENCAFAVEEGTAFVPFQGKEHYDFAANRCRAIRALPALTLKDLTDD